MCCTLRTCFTCIDRRFKPSELAMLDLAGMARPIDYYTQRQHFILVTCLLLYLKGFVGYRSSRPAPQYWWIAIGGLPCIGANLDIFMSVVFGKPALGSSWSASLTELTCVHGVPTLSSSLVPIERELLPFWGLASVVVSSLWYKARNSID